MAERLSVRFPDDLYAQIREYKKRHGIVGDSTVVRILMRLGLGMPVEDAAVREGISHGMSILRRRLSQVIDQALNEMPSQEDL